MSTRHLCVARASLYLYIDSTGQYDEFGSVGCTIVGTSGKDPVYKLGCYNDANEYVCTGNISASNEAGANVALQGSYVSFKDEAGKTWSLQFDSEEEAVEFCGSVAVAMYGAAGQPPGSILVCDVAKGVAGKTALAGSLVKVRFIAWVLETEQRSSIATLGSKLDAMEQKLFTVTVPANHLSVSSDMKGFEGMLIGMREQGCRLVVIPKAVQRGAGPNISMCYFVEMVRIKADESSSAAGTAPLALTASPGASAALVAQPLNSALASQRAVSSARPGFDRDQFMLVDRLRDQVFTLTEQLREARQQLQTFGADVRAYEQERRPKSLLNAQIEHTVHTLLTEVDEQKERLAQRNETLARMEEKNAQLQHSVNKFQETARLLTEEKQSAMSAQDEERLELDRQILQAQTHLNRLSSEVEDVLRHTNSVKRLLSQTESDTKKEKSDLQVTLVASQTNESRLATVKEALHEESERCTLLDSKVGLLSAELQTHRDDIEARDRVIEACRRQTESEVLHYEQLMDDERQKAAAELREVRQGLLEELGARDRRYQEERQRVAQDAHERGRVQGVEDGTAEALLTADLKAREMTLAIQRCNAEAKAMEARIRVAKDERRADERRLELDKESAEERLKAEESACADLETEIETLTQRRDLATDTVYDTLQEALKSASGTISQRMLLRIVDAVQSGITEADFTLQARESLEDRRRQEQEKADVEAWVRAAVYNQAASMPALRESCSVVEPSLEEDENASGGQFFKLDDILRIREPRRVAEPPPRPLPVPPPIASSATTTVAPQPTLVAPGAVAPAGPPVEPPSATPPPPPAAAATVLFTARNPFQKSTGTAAPQQSSVGASQLPQQQAFTWSQPPPQPPLPPPPSYHPQGVPQSQPQPSVAPLLQAPVLPYQQLAGPSPPFQPQPQHPQEPQGPAPAPQVSPPSPQGSVSPAPVPSPRQVMFPPPHIRPLEDFRPPPSLN